MLDMFHKQYSQYFKLWDIVLEKDYLEQNTYKSERPTVIFLPQAQLFLA